MNEYSIIGSNISNSKLLFLKSNENDTKITIHNNSGYFETTYNNSNLITTNFNDKLHFKNIIDDDYYINFHVHNDTNLLLNYTFGQDNDTVDIKNINFNSINNQDKNDIDNDGQIYTSSFIFTNKVNDVGNYVCFESTTTIESHLTNLNFFDQNLTFINKSNIKGVFIVIKLDKKYNLQQIKWIFETNYTFPHKINLYSKLNNNLYKIYENQFFNDSNGNIQFTTLYNSDTYVLNIESVLLLKSFYDTTINLNQNDNGFLNINQNNNIIKRENNVGDQSQYSLALNFKNIEITKKIHNIINHYDIDMKQNNIFNINSISTDKIILNNKIYDDIISQDTVVSVVTDIINNQNNLFEQIITDTLDYNSINIDNLTQTFNPAVLSQNFINNKNYQKPESNLYIPFVEYFFENDFSSSIRIHYYSNVNIKHLVELSSLSNEDAFLKHKNGTIYKDNKINNLIIDNNIEVNNDLIVDNKIIINSNVLEWNPELNKFKYSSNIQIQNSLFYSVKIEPVISNINIDSSNFSDFIFEYGYNDYKISHPSFRTYKSLAPNSFPELISAYWNNNVNILKLILNHNIYLSARYGSSSNLIDNVNDKYNLIKNDFINNDSHKYYYNGDQEYLDFFEYETNTSVLLKKISFYDISIEEFNNLGSEYKGNWNQYYTAQNKNNIDNFKLLGSNDNEWDLIHSQSNIESIQHYDTQFRSYNIYVENKYKKYRFVFGNNDITLPFIIKDLRFYFEKTDNLNNIIYTENFIDKTHLNLLSINNQTDWDRSVKSNYIFNNKDRTKLIINEDTDKTYQHNNSFAVVHINEEYNKLNYGIDDDDDIHMLRMTLNNNNINNLYSVYHTLNIKNDSLYYVISPYNTLDDNRNINNNNIILGISKKETKDYEEKGTTGINLSSKRLSDMIDNSDNHINKCNGLVIDPKIRLCLYNNDNHSNILNGYLDIGINSNINIDNSYHINLPYNSSNIDNNSTFYLEIDNFDKTNKIINTKWGIVGESIFNSEKIYIGLKDNSNIHEQHFNIEYCNLDITTSNYIPENLLHIRKAFIGLPNNINNNIDIINNNVLTVGGQIYATTDVATDSDISYKFDFEQIIDPKDKINKLTGYTFNRNDTTEQRRFCGLIAQDVEKILPEAIIKKHDGKLRVMYNNLACLFVECFKDLYKEIDELKKEVHICKEKL